MIGMDRVTGRALGGVDHLHQSVSTILGTPLGTRIGRRDFGSLIPELLDQPLNDRTRLALIAAGALALLRQEPRIRARRILLEIDAAGTAALRIIGTRTDGARAGTALDLTTPVRAARALA